MNFIEKRIKYYLNKLDFWVKDLKFKVKIFIENSFLSQKSLSKKKIFEFFHNLENFMLNGYSLSQAITILYNSTSDKKMKKMYAELNEHLAKGLTMSSFFERNNYIPQEYVIFLGTGEETGNLVASSKEDRKNSVLHILIEKMKKEIELKEKLMESIKYPLITLVVAGGIGLFMTYKVMPSIVDNLAKLAGGIEKLPKATRMLYYYMNFMLTYKKQLAIGAIFFAVIIYYILSSGILFMLLKNRIFQIPFLGRWYKINFYLNFFDSIRTYLKVNISLPHGLENYISKEKNTFLKVNLLKTKNMLMSGESLSKSLPPILFDSFIIDSLKRGEKVDLVSQIDFLIDYYRDELDKIYSMIQSYIQPAILVIVGLGVGGVAFTLIKGIYSFIAAFGKGGM